MIEDQLGRARPGATAFVLLTYALSWPVWLTAWQVTGRPATLTAAPGIVAAIYAGSFAPGIAAAILSAGAGRHALGAWLRKFVRFRCGWRTYLAALVPLPLAVLALSELLGYAPRVAGLHGRPAALLYLTLFPVSLFNGVATALLGAGPLGEEGGWRGYLLPRLLARGGEARASFVIGLVWGLWHLPVMALFADWRSNVPFTAYLPLYVLGTIAMSFLFSRVWRLGSGSLVPCIWLHGLVNAVGGPAFDHRVWVSRWSPEASTAHFALAAAIAATAVILTSGWPAMRRDDRG